MSEPKTLLVGLAIGSKVYVKYEEKSNTLICNPGEKEVELDVDSSLDCTIEKTADGACKILLDGNVHQQDRQAKIGWLWSGKPGLYESLCDWALSIRMLRDVKNPE